MSMEQPTMGGETRSAENLEEQEKKTRAIAAGLAVTAGILAVSLFEHKKQNDEVIGRLKESLAAATKTVAKIENERAEQARLFEILETALDTRPIADSPEHRAGLIKSLQEELGQQKSGVLGPYHYNLTDTDIAQIAVTRFGSRWAQEATRKTENSLDSEALLDLRIRDIDFEIKYTEDAIAAAEKDEMNSMMVIAGNEINRMSGRGMNEQMVDLMDKYLNLSNDFSNVLAALKVRLAELKMSRKHALELPNRISEAFQLAGARQESRIKERKYEGGNK